MSVFRSYGSRVKVWLCLDTKIYWIVLWADSFVQGNLFNFDLGMTIIRLSLLVLLDTWDISFKNWLKVARPVFHLDTLQKVVTESIFFIPESLSIGALLWKIINSFKIYLLGHCLLLQSTDQPKKKKKVNLLKMLWTFKHYIKAQ